MTAFPSFMGRAALAAAAIAALAACEGPVADARAAEEKAAPARPAAPPPRPASAANVPSTQALSDPAITARVQQGIARDPALAGADISVNTDRGVVSLSGSVQTQEQLAVASAHASAQDGVMRVDDHLAIQPR